MEGAFSEMEIIQMSLQELISQETEEINNGGKEEDINVLKNEIDYFEKALRKKTHVSEGILKLLSHF
jgi:hypothetical protein